MKTNKTPPLTQARNYRGTAFVSLHVEVDLGEVEALTSAVAKRHFAKEAESFLAGCGKIELIRHSSHCGVDLVHVSVQKS